MSHRFLPALALALILVFLPIQRAEAVSKEVRTVFVTGLYGILGGTALGLVAWPLGNIGPRTVFMGSAVGLYLGIVAGIYHNHSRSDPNNPFRRAQGFIPPVQMSPFHFSVADVSGLSGIGQGAAHSPPWLELNYTVFRF